MRIRGRCVGIFNGRNEGRNDGLAIYGSKNDPYAHVQKTSSTIKLRLEILTRGMIPKRLPELSTREDCPLPH